MGRFALNFRRLRADAGFPTSYAFYHRNGGKRAFPFTYAYYAKLERGAGLPRAEWLPLLLSMLRISPAAEDQRRLIEDYLFDLVGHEGAFKELVAPLLIGTQTGGRRRRVMKKLLSAQAYHLTPEQFAVITESEAAYWAYTILVNNRQPSSPKALAEAAGIPLAKVKQALKELTRRKLARPASGGKYKSPLAGRYCVFPRGYPGYEKHLKLLKNYIEKAAKRRGTALYDAGIVLRADPAAAEDGRRAFQEAIESASASSLDSPAPDSACYVLEARIRRLFDF